MMNADNLTATIDTYINDLKQLRSHIESGNGDALEAAFAKASKTRRGIKGAR